MSKGFDDPFGIELIDQTREFVKIGWYSIQGFSDRGAGYRLVVDNEGSKLTYYRPANWTDEDWDEFVSEMEEPYGASADPE